MYYTHYVSCVGVHRHHMARVLLNAMTHAGRIAASVRTDTRREQYCSRCMRVCVQILYE